LNTILLFTIILFTIITNQKGVVNIKKLKTLSILFLSIIILTLTLTGCDNITDNYIAQQLEKDLKNSTYIYEIDSNNTSNSSNTIDQTNTTNTNIQSESTIPKTQSIIQNNENDTLKIKKYIQLGIDNNKNNNSNNNSNILKENTIKNSNSESIIISNTLLEIAMISAEYSNLLKVYNLADAKQYYYENKDKLRISMVFVDSEDEDKNSKDSKKDKDKLGNAVIVIGNSENVIQPLSRKVVSLNEEDEDESENENKGENGNKPKIKLVIYEYDLNLIRNNKVFKFIIVENDKKSIFNVNLNKLRYNEY